MQSILLFISFLFVLFINVLRIIMNKLQIYNFICKQNLCNMIPKAKYLLPNNTPNALFENKISVN